MLSPRSMALPAKVQKLVGGSRFCALFTDGKVGCWNSPAQTTVAPIAELASATDLAACQDAVCTVADGKVQCAGIGPCLDPTAAGPLGSVVSIASGSDHMCILNEAGEVRCWGYDGNSAVGGAGAGKISLPGKPSALFAAADATCAITNGVPTCWGFWFYECLRQFPNSRCGSGPAVIDLSNTRSGAVGGMYLGFVHTDGTVSRFGSWLGDIRQWRNPPSTVPGFSNVKSLALGSAHGCALLDSGRVQCIGSNEQGQVGAGATQTVTTPAFVSL